MNWNSWNGTLAGYWYLKEKEAAKPARVDVAEVLRLDREATPGPWWPRFGGEPGRVSDGKQLIAEVPMDMSDLRPRPTSQAIALFRTACPALARELVEVRRILLVMVDDCAYCGGDGKDCDENDEPAGDCPLCSKARTYLSTLPKEAERA